MKNVIDRYSSTGPGRPVYDIVKKALSNRLAKQGMVTTTDAWQTVRTKYSYAVVSMCFSNIMREMIEQGIAVKLARRGTYWIGARRSFMDAIEQTPELYPEEAVAEPVPAALPAEQDPEKPPRYFRASANVAPWFSKVYNQWMTTE